MFPFFHIPSNIRSVNTNSNFVSSVPIDTYNIDAVEISRGPNSTSVPSSGMPLRASLSPAFAVRLHGPVLHSSVSRLELFAACPFRFFVHSGLRAEERKRFEVDARERGSFQHDVLRRFHEAVRNYYQKKMAKTNRIVAIKALSHKLTRASYYVMRDQVDYDPTRLFQ